MKTKNTEDAHKPHVRKKIRQFQTDCLALLEQLPHLLPNQPTPWDLHGKQEFLRDGFVVRYVSAEYAALFEPYIHYKYPLLKLINPLQPAVRLSYYDKHKYWLLKPEQTTRERKQLEIVQYLEWIDRERDKVMARRQTLISANGRTNLDLELARLDTEQSRWQEILAGLTDYDIALSTYYTEYRYWYVGWKWATGDEGAPEYDNDVTHLLSPIRERDGSKTTKTNVIFVDLPAILVAHDYQHKQIEQYLTNFGLHSEGPKVQLFARLRSESNQPGNQVGFKPSPDD